MGMQSMCASAGQLMGALEEGAGALDRLGAVLGGVLGLLVVADGAGALPLPLSQPATSSAPSASVVRPWSLENEAWSLHRLEPIAGIMTSSARR